MFLVYYFDILNYANYGIFFYISVFFVEYLELETIKTEKTDIIFLHFSRQK